MKNTVSYKALWLQMCERCDILDAKLAEYERAERATQPVDLPDLIAGALGVSRGTAYDMMREALAEQHRH